MKLEGLRGNWKGNDSHCVTGCFKLCDHMPILRYHLWYEYLGRYSCTVYGIWMTFQKDHPGGGLENELEDSQPRGGHFDDLGEKRGVEAGLLHWGAVCNATMVLGEPFLGSNFHKKEGKLSTRLSSCWGEGCEAPVYSPSFRALGLCYQGS